jgi:hypothetical protein
MKATRIVLLALSLGALAGAASASPSITAGLNIGSSGRAAVDVGFFYDDLAPYGNWVDRPQHGWCFVPRHTRSNWRPYQAGHWTLTDYGWTWVSDEPYGWATYHYGRWSNDPDYGWEWVPGQQWGPAWVSWQEGGDYVGWAPLPPTAEFSGNYGVDYGGVSFAASLVPDSYLFVPERNFLAPRLDSYFVPQARIGGFWGQTRNFTNYRFENNRFINQGVPVDRIQRGVGHTIPRYQVADLAEGQRHQREQLRGNQIGLFRPEVRRAASVAPPPSRPLARRAVMTAAAAAAVVGAHHARQTALQANAAHAGNAGGTAGRNARNARNARVASNTERQQTRQTRVARQNVTRSRQAQARQQQVAARSQQRVSRQQQIKTRPATARQQQRVSRQQVNPAGQQQAMARQQRVSHQQVNPARQQQAVARQQRVSHQQVNPARQQQRVSRQQASPRQAQAPRSNRPGVQGQQQARPRGGNPDHRPPNPPGQ